MGLTHVVCGLPITALITRNFYAQIPMALIESGRLNGAGFFSIYRRIVFPLSILTAIPVLTTYIFLGRYFIRGLLAGSVKK